MTMMRDGRRGRRRRTATSITTFIAAGFPRRHSVQMGNRTKGGEALVVSVRPLDFLAIVDGTGRSGERRSEQTETQQAENRRSASKNLHPLSVAPVLF
jgi:hypothetical protein